MGPLGVSIFPVRTSALHGGYARLPLLPFTHAPLGLGACALGVPDHCGLSALALRGHRRASTVRFATTTIDRVERAICICRVCEEPARPSSRGNVLSVLLAAHAGAAATRRIPELGRAGALG